MKVSRDADEKNQVFFLLSIVFINLYLKSYKLVLKEKTEKQSASFRVEARERKSNT